MFRKTIALMFSTVLMCSAPVIADDLTQMVQQDLNALGYQPGSTDGEMTMKTAIAISRFQAEHDFEVTGEASPQLAGILKAEVRGRYQAATVGSAPVARPTQADLQARQQICLQQKMAEAQAIQKKKRGFGRLLSAVTRTANQRGNYDLARSVNDVYAANATADDLTAAAKDLGLTENDLEECRNSQ
jgi:peptidoglycan hydrolase-like protein with peptidoglycan-binding domain